MPLADVQRRYRELGRIRLGKKGPKGEPQKLDTFRLTSPAEFYLTAAAEQYGGTVEPWDDAPTLKQYQIITETAQIEVVVPPQGITDRQSYTLWTAGGMQRQCDGLLQTNSNPCVCDATDRECKPSTRLEMNVPSLPGFGVWVCTSTGYNAAAELPVTAEFLSAAAAAGVDVPAVLMIKHGTSKVDDRTYRYMMPSLDMVGSVNDLEAAQGVEPGTIRRILAAGPQPVVAAGRPELPAERAALPAEPAPIPTPDDSVDSLAPTGIAAGGSTDVPSAETPDPAAPTETAGDSADDGPVADPPTLAPHDPIGGSAAEIRTAVMELAPSEAIVLARLLLTANERPATAEAMPAHQLWVRRLFYAMERCGLWRPVPPDPRTTVKPLDPLHLTLGQRHQVDHLGDLRRDDLLNFCTQAADAAALKLGEAE